MTNILVERLLLASLHKALEKHAPEYLEIFSRWFYPSSRQTRFHVATIIGAVGYLRRNPTVYQKVIGAAGRTASDRAYGGFSPIGRRLLESLPRFVRERLVKHLLHSGLRSIHKDALIFVKRAGEKIFVTVDNSLFCYTPAENEGLMRCHFYATLFAGLLEKADLPCDSVREVTCRGQGDATCSFEVQLARPRAA
jgi:predicted hydrocarbon binding protein